MTFYTVDYQYYHQRWRSTHWQYETYEGALEEVHRIVGQFIHDSEYVRVELRKHKGVADNAKPPER